MNKDSYEMIATKTTYGTHQEEKLLSQFYLFFYLIKNQKILEIGCGVGSNLSMLSNLGM